MSHATLNTFGLTVVTALALASATSMGRADEATKHFKPTSAKGPTAAALQATTKPSINSERRRGVPTGKVQRTEHQISTAAAPAARAAQNTTERTRGVNIIGSGQGGAGGAALNLTSLAQMLDNMGYEYQKLGDGSMYEIKMTQGTWTTYQIISLSNDGTVLWWTGLLSKFDSVEAIPQAKLAAMLASGGSLGFPFFSLNADNGQVLMMQALPNEGISPVKMRGYIERFSEAIISTGDIWSP